MKKIKIMIIFFIAILSINLVKGANPRLITITTNTWAENHHIDWVGIDYTGIISINGSERTNRNQYPRMIKLSYDVQGKWSKIQQYSSGNKTLQKTLKVGDAFNLGAKTKVYYDYSLTTQSNQDVMKVKTSK